MDFQSIQKQISALKEGLAVLEQGDENEIEPIIGVVEFNKSAEELKKKLTNLKDESAFFKNVFKNVFHLLQKTFTILSFLRMIVKKFFYIFQKPLNRLLRWNDWFCLSLRLL